MSVMPALLMATMEDPHRNQSVLTCLQWHCFHNKSVTVWSVPVSRTDCDVAICKLWCSCHSSGLAFSLQSSLDMPPQTALMQEHHSADRDHIASSSTQPKFWFWSIAACAAAVCALLSRHSVCVSVQAAEKQVRASCRHHTASILS